MRAHQVAAELEQNYALCVDAQKQLQDTLAKRVSTLWAAVEKAASANELAQLTGTVGKLVDEQNALKTTIKEKWGAENMAVPTKPITAGGAGIRIGKNDDDIEDSAREGSGSSASTPSEKSAAPYTAPPDVPKLNLDAVHSRGEQVATLEQQQLLLQSDSDAHSKTLNDVLARLERLEAVMGTEERVQTLEVGAESVSARLEDLEARTSALFEEAAAKENVPTPADKTRQMLQGTMDDVEDVRVAHMMLESFCRKEVGQLTKDVAAIAAAVESMREAAESREAARASPPRAPAAGAAEVADAAAVGAVPTSELPSPAHSQAQQGVGERNAPSVGVRGLRNLRRERSSSADGRTDTANVHFASYEHPSPPARPTCVPGDVMEIVGIGATSPTDPSRLGAAAQVSPALNVSPVVLKSRQRGTAQDATRGGASAYLASVVATPPRRSSSEGSGTATNLLEQFENQGQGTHPLVSGTGGKLVPSRGTPVSASTQRPPSRADGKAETHESPGHRAAASAAASAASAEKPKASPGAAVAASAIASTKRGSLAAAAPRPDRSAVRARRLFRPPTSGSVSSSSDGLTGVGPRAPQPPSGPRRASAFRGRVGAAPRPNSAFSR